MDIHKNARLSFRSRESLAEFVVKQGATRKAAAAAFRVTAKTVAKWVGRYIESGVAGLGDRSSRPRCCPRQTSSSLVEEVVVLRRGHMPGYEIARRTGLSPASVSRILRRARLSRWRDLNPPPPVQRYEHPRPGDLLHLDIKGMTRFSEVSRRGDGRLRGKRKHPGFLALHVAVDDHSRMAFTQMLPDQKAETTIGFLRSAVEFFARHGIGVRALLTDNGSCYRSGQFRVACQQMQLKHRRTRPYTPLALMARRRGLSRPRCANGPTPNTGSNRSNEISACSPGPTTTTTKDHMVASTTSRPSAAPISVQPLDHLQSPSSPEITTAPN
jgi:transposase